MVLNQFDGLRRVGKNQKICEHRERYSSVHLWCTIVVGFGSLLFNSLGCECVGEALASDD